MSDEFELVDVVREVSFVLHKKDEPLVPRCFWTVHIDGPRGHVNSLHGDGFLKNPDLVMAGARKYGIKTLQAPMIPAVAEAIVRRFPDRSEITHREYTDDGEPRDYLIFRCDE